MIDLAEALKELYQLMIAEVLRSRVPHTDDTPRERLVELLPHRWKPSTTPPVSPADQAANV
jgi:hypothetical protein